MVCTDGAGVDILAMPFWIQAIPHQKHSWIIAPTGRTAWVRPVCSRQMFELEHNAFSVGL